MELVNVNGDPKSRLNDLEDGEIGKAKTNGRLAKSNGKTSGKTAAAGKSKK